VAIGEKNVALNIDKEVVASSNVEPATGSILPLDPPTPAKKNYLIWIFAGLLAMVFLFGVSFLGFNLLKNRSVPRQKKTVSEQVAMLHVKHGPQTGRSFVLKNLPCSIGRDPQNEICINDPHIMSQHARIFAANNDYYLMDLSGNTFINGQALSKGSVVLKSGDVVRLGKSALFVFAA
jgi:hypothetical protein